MAEQRKFRNLNDELGHFYGTSQWYKHPLTGLLYTDGVKYVADKFEAYWLLDSIFIENTGDLAENEPFQKWTLHRVFETPEVPTDRFMLICEDGNKNIVLAHGLPFSDFIPDSITFFFIEGVLLLPSEN